MKIGILTRRAGFNHGSSLQAFAMARLLSMTGASAEIIDYDEYAAHPMWNLRPFFENIEWGVMRNTIKHLNPKHYHYLQLRNAQCKKFKDFEVRFLPLSINKCRTAKQLSEIADNYNAIVCGSDQIWSPLLYDSNYLCGFLQKGQNVKTVAYAPSFGISDSDMLGEEECRLISQFDFLSCREQTGKEIIEKRTGRKAELVLDPTLMIPMDVWKSMIPVNTPGYLKEDYILCYFLGSNVHQNYIDKLKKATGFKVYNINMFNRMNQLKSDREINDIGPIEFLQMISNSSAVCTDSFHAAIFSFLFNKRLSLFIRFLCNDAKSQNSRIYTLSEILKLKRFLVRDDNDTPPNAYPQSTEAIASLERWREVSWSYLSSAGI